MQNDKEKFKNEFKKRLYKFVLNTISMAEKLPKDSTCRIIGDQLIRSVTSICANYIEAQSSSSRKDYTNFFQISLKSANESKFWIALLRDAGKVASTITDNLLEELNEISKIFGSSILTLKNRK